MVEHGCALRVPHAARAVLTSVLFLATRNDSRLCRRLGDPNRWLLASFTTDLMAATQVIYARHVANHEACDTGLE